MMMMVFMLLAPCKSVQNRTPAKADRPVPDSPLDRFTKRFLWNIDKREVDSMEEYHACPKSENKFCPKVAPSLSSGTHFLGWVGSSRKCYEARQYLPPVKLVSLDLAPDITQVPSDNTQAHQTPLQTPQTHRQTPPDTPPDRQW